MPAATSSDPPAFLKLIGHQLRWQLLSTLAHSDRRVQELVAEVGEPANLVSYHLRQLRGQALVSERRSAADGRDVYYSLDLERLRGLYLAAGETLHPGLAHLPAGAQAAATRAGRRPRVLFLCTHNSARSQMAEGILRHLAAGRIEVASAGTVATAVHPLAIQALAEQGIDIGYQRSKPIDELAGQTFDYVVTVCDNARESCPVFTGAPDRIHWSIADPSAVEGDKRGKLRAFRSARDELTARIRYLLTLIERGRG